MSDIEGTTIYDEVVTWINNNPLQFGKKDKPIYDKENLERIKRFAKAPNDYIDERIELNKKVSENYHKIHTSILLAGATGFYGYLVSTTIIKIVNTTDSNIIINNIILIGILLLLGIWALHLKIQTQILNLSGLKRVIRDSEIEIYYLSKIKEHRNKPQS